MIDMLAERSKSMDSHLSDRRQPALAVIVISLGAPPELAGAVRSLIDQDVPIEMMVVNSGGGDAAGLLRKMDLDIPAYETTERLFAGAVRNIGIEHTKAPFVAFLASDCLAAPGWVEERMRLHKEGARMVASAVMPDPPDNIVAWAHHLLLFPYRLPGLPANQALRYGVSFDRHLFNEVGNFDGDLATGEDTEFLDRLAGTLQPLWASTVITRHRNATSVTTLLCEQVARGYRYGRAMRRLRRVGPFKLAIQALRQPHRSIQLAQSALTGRDLEFAIRSKSLVRIGSLAKALGILATLVVYRRAGPNI